MVPSLASLALKGGKESAGKESSNGRRSNITRAITYPPYAEAGRSDKVVSGFHSQQLSSRLSLTNIPSH